MGGKLSARKLGDYPGCSSYVGEFTFGHPSINYKSMGYIPTAEDMEFAQWMANEHNKPFALFKEDGMVKTIQTGMKAEIKIPSDALVIGPGESWAYTGNMGWLKL